MDIKSINGRKARVILSGTPRRILPGVREKILRRVRLRMTGAAICVVSLALVGCEVGPNYSPPKVEVLDQFGELGREPTTQPSGRAVSRIISGSPALDWWQAFHDPELDQLIRRAIDSNNDLKLATERVREARAERATIRSDLFPTINANGSYEHSRLSENGLTSAFAGESGGQPGANGAAAVPGSSLGQFDLYQAGFDANWELDIFGGQRRAVEAATADVQAAIERRRDVLITVLAEVARNYIELRSNQRRTEIARENLATQKRSLDLIRDRVQQGLTNELDLARAQAQVASTEAQLPQFEIGAGEAIHRLSILIDQRPTALADELSKPDAIPALPVDVPVGLPSDLLRRRPDIRAAERQLASATARVGVATAQLYPQFSLTGSAGLQSTEPGNLVEYASRFYSIGPSVSWPVFDAGRVRAALAANESRQSQAMISFRVTVLRAFGEVEDALLEYSRLQQRTRSLDRSVVANRKAVRIAQDLYQQGLGDYLSVLDAQRSLLAAEDMLAQSESQTDTALIALYKSLGGGWELDALQQVTQPAASVVPVKN